MENKQLKIEYLRKSELKPYVHNAKLHSAEQIEQIVKSIREFGFNDPVAVWKDNEIIEGHGRLLAALQMPEIDEVPVIRLDSLSDEQRKAYMLVHNKLTMNTDFDINLLENELKGIADIDMTSYGFQQMLKEIEKIEQKEKEKPETPFTEVLGEEHNYIVLYFDNTVDWLQMQSIIDISGKMNLSIKRDGNISDAMKRVSVGRVFKGKEVLEKMRQHFEHLH